MRAPDNNLESLYLRPMNSDRSPAPAAGLETTATIDFIRAIDVAFPAPNRIGARSRQQKTLHNRIPNPKGEARAAFRRVADKREQHG